MLSFTRNFSRSLYSKLGPTSSLNWINFLNMTQIMYNLDLLKRQPAGTPRMN